MVKVHRAGRDWRRRSRIIQNVSGLITEGAVERETYSSQFPTFKVCNQLIGSNNFPSASSYRISKGHRQAQQISSNTLWGKMLYNQQIQEV